MALYKISDRYPNYRDVYFEGGDLKGMNVYSAQGQAVGRVCELLIDDSDRLKYLVVELQGQKQVLLPVRSCARTTDANSLYAPNLSRDDISRLAIYGGDNRLLEETLQEKAVEQHSASGQTTGYQMAPVEYSAPVEMTNPAVPVDSVVNRTVLEQTTPEQAVSEQASMPDSSQFSLYEERLSTRKQRVKTGEVRISKRTVTETAETVTPIKKEKIIIEIESIYGGDTQIDVDGAEVAEDGSISMGIYEERTEVCRQVKPYQNISVRKEVVEDVVRAQATLRREELSVDPDGLPYIDWADT